MEIWKDIDGFNGKYQISSWGRVRNAETGNILKTFRNEKGYLKIKLFKNENKKGHNYRVSRLVAQAFVRNPYNLPQVNHKDGNKENNSYTNLEWTTNEINQKHKNFLKSGGYLA